MDQRRSIAAFSVWRGLSPALSPPDLPHDVFVCLVFLRALRVFRGQSYLFIAMPLSPEQKQAVAAWAAAGDNLAAIQKKLAETVQTFP